MIRLIQLEIYKMVRRGLTYIGFGAILLIALIIHTGMRAEGRRLLDLLINNLADVFAFQGELINVYTVGYVILNSLLIHVPTLVAIVSGDMLSGEAGRGTFRLILTRPVSRTRLVAAKYISAQLYTASLMLFLYVASLLIGRLFYGPGDMIVLLNTINIIDQQDALWRFAGAFAFGILGMWVVSGIAFLFSALSNNSLTAVLGTLAVMIVFTIISNFSIGVFEFIKPFLFTTYLNGWILFFDNPVNWSKIIHYSLILATHITLFFVMAVMYFRRKDITT